MLSRAYHNREAGELCGSDMSIALLLLWPLDELSGGALHRSPLISECEVSLVRVGAYGRILSLSVAKP